MRPMGSSAEPSKVTQKIGALVPGHRSSSSEGAISGGLSILPSLGWETPKSLGWFG